MVDGVNQPGLFQRIGNFFGAGDPNAGQRMGTPFFPDDPNAGQSTDPFAGLSRAQRTMLGFSALRDAAASLEGRDSNFFAQSLGQFEQGRERERLRTQGETQNRVQALQALATLNEQMRYNQAFGLPTDPATEALREALMTAAGFGGGASPMARGAPAMPAAVAPTTRLPTGSAVVDASGAVVGDIDDEPLSPAAQAAMEGAPAPTAAPTDRLSQIDAEIAQLTQAMTPRVAAGAGVADLQAQIDQRIAERERLIAGTAAAEQEETARLAGEDEARQAGFYVNLIESVMQDPALEGVVGRIEGRVDPMGAGGAALFDEDEMNVLSKLDQLGGAAFLQAFESLKGGGQITQIEGEKATAAITRLTRRAVSPENYRAALEELRQVYANAQARARGEELPFPEINVEGAAPQNGLTPEQQALVDRYSQ